MSAVRTSALRVLVVDDSGYARLRIRRFLEAEGTRDVIEACDGESALVAYRREHPTLVLIDQVMRGIDGVEVARRIVEKDPSARIVMLTVVDDPGLRSRAIDAGILMVLDKGEMEEKLRPMLQVAHES